MKKYSSILFLFVVVTPLSGQQLAQFSQYLHNPILLNPATTGVNNNLNLDISYRNQWTGFKDAPSTYYISCHATLFREKKTSSLRMSRPGYTVVKKPKRLVNHGIGGYVISDKYGAFSNTSGYLSYAMHVAIGMKIKMSLGISSGVSNWKLNEDDVKMADKNDDTYNYFMDQRLSKTFFDFNGGIWVYSEAFYAGYSSEQLLQNQIVSVDIPAEAKVKVHHFATAGYKFKINDDFDLTPSMLIKYMQPSPVSFDFNVKASYRRQIWCGISYRHNDAIIGMLGYELNDKFKIGYSYDFTLSGLKKYSSGSHEIVLGVKFFKDAQRSSISFL